MGNKDHCKCSRCSLTRSLSTPPKQRTFISLTHNPQSEFGKYTDRTQYGSSASKAINNTTVICQKDNRIKQSSNSKAVKRTKGNNSQSKRGKTGNSFVQSLPGHMVVKKYNRPRNNTTTSNSSTIYPQSLSSYASNTERSFLSSGQSNTNSSILANSTINRHDLYNHIETHSDFERSGSYQLGDRNGGFARNQYTSDGYNTRIHAPGVVPSVLFYHTTKEDRGFANHDFMTSRNYTPQSLHQSFAGQSQMSALSVASSMNTSYPDRHRNICNIFWHAGLVCCSFTKGDSPVPFSALWPPPPQVESLLWEAYNGTSLKKCVLDMCRISICCGPVTLLKSLLTLNIIGVNTSLESGSSLLHLSCVAQNKDAVSVLCNKGAKRNSTDKQGRTVLEVCHSPDIKQALLQLPSNTDAATTNSNHSNKAATNMSPNSPHLQVVNSANSYHQQQRKVIANTSASNVVTMAKKISPTLYDKEIIFECASSCTDVDELLLKLQTYNFDVNSEVNEHGDFLIHTVVKEGVCELPVLTQLVQHYSADINLLNKAGHTPLMITAQAGNHVLADVLLCVLGANPDIQTAGTLYTALHYACIYNQVDTVSVLLKRGADFNLEDMQKMRPDDLVMSQLGGGKDCCELVDIQRRQRMARLFTLIEKDILTKDNLRLTDLSATDPETGNTLVMLAASMNKSKSLRLLLSYPDIPINAQHEKTMQTALSFAAEEGNIEAMCILMEHGCNPAVLDIDRLISVHHGIRNNHVQYVTKFLQMPGCLLGLELGLRMAESDDMKKVIKAAMNRRQRDLVTPALFECAMSGDAEKLFCVLEEGDCINPVSGMGVWPLYLAVENQHFDIIKLLCQNGADLSRKHSSIGNTVLHLACSRGHYKIVAFLLDCYKTQSNNMIVLDPKQTIHAMNYDNKTALVLAAEKGHSRVVELLLQHGSSTAVLDPAGQLYSCQQYHGCQSLIEARRGQHVRAVFSVLREGGSAGRDKLKSVFLPQFDHNLRDDRGYTPLMSACLAQNTPQVKYLLESAVYVLEHSKNFHGSFAQSFISSRNGGSDSGKHTLNHDNNETSGIGGVCMCKDKDDDKKFKAVLPTTGDSVVGEDICQYCLYGNSRENLTTACDCSHSNNNNKEQCTNCQDNSNRGDTAPQKDTISFHIGDDERCMCSKCSEDSITNSGDRTKHLVRKNSDLPNAIGSSGSGSKKSLPEEEEYEQQIQENMSALFTSITSVNNRGSIFVTEIMVSHLCAINSVEGSTCFHCVIEAGDNVSLFGLLLDADHTGVNIQDNLGLAPLHLACHFNRRKIAEKLTSLAYVDLNVRTLDGKLPEEMTTDKRIHRLILKARNLEPTKSVLSPLMSLSQSVFGFTSTYAASSIEAESVDFDRTHNQFMAIKEQMHHRPSHYLDEGTMMMASIHF